jgi:DNA-binding protein YbaB
MKVIMRHVSGTAKANLERAKEELTRVLGFRGDVVSAKANGQRTTLEIAINPKWENEDKVGYLKEWIPTKGRKVFEVISVSEKRE